MTRLLPVVLLSIVCLNGQDALAHHHLRHAGKTGAQAPVWPERPKLKPAS
jgi:hypothetical protein